MANTPEKVKNWRKNTKLRIINSMGGQCQICGYNKYSGSLELHHLDPTEKEFKFGRIRANPISAEKIKEELKKCILLCSNCHKEVHGGLTTIPEEYTKFDDKLFST